MQVFLTGGTGFIGSHFVNQAHEAGERILALRHRPDSKARVPLAQEPQWVDKTMAEVTPDDLAGCEVMVHLAAHSANVPYDTLEHCLEKNLIAPLRLFRTAIAAGIRRFIVAGSCFEYGRAGERYEFIPVDAPLEPTLSYPTSKAAASVAFHSLACEENLELLILRIFQVYGQGEAESRFWPALRKAALAGDDFPMTQGDQIRDFIYVSDVAAHFVKALRREDIPAGRPLIGHVGSGIPMTLAEFAARQWTAFGAKGKLLLGAVPKRSGEIHRYVPLISR
jgi:nucleoside-diphosphate-sugar epimerase